ncbi:MAG: hypothetical protein ACW99Q_00195, partial [Candidatus Kariarchaeaceae archaeon]
GTLSSWTFTYAIDSGDSASGTFTITYTATDNVDNTNTATFEFREDNTDPLVDIDPLYQQEQAYTSYIHWDISNVKWWYGDGMDSNEAEFTVGVDANDLSGAGLLEAVVAADLGGSVGERTDSSENSLSGRTYDVPVVDITSSDTWEGNLVITVWDLVGNTNTTTIAVGYDVSAPSITQTSSNTNESSSYLYYDGSSVFGYYSDNMGGTTTIFNVGGLSSDTGAGIQSITDNTAFGNNPTRSGSLAIWTFSYAIDSADSAFGTFTITYTVTDNVGNSDTDTFEFREDNTAPAISHNAVGTSESSSYLYYDGVSSNGYYSDNMGGSTQNFVIAGTASDGGADLFSITDDTTFGNNPGRSGSLASWIFTYAIDSADSVFGTFSVTYAATDNVANSGITTFEFREDNTVPSISLNTGSISETSNFLYYDGSSAFGYYSDNMGVTPENFIIAGSASDSGVGLQSISDDTTFGNNPGRGGTLTSWTFTYGIDSGDSGSGVVSITYTARDEVGNTDTVSFEFREDNIAPVISRNSAGTSELSTNLYYDGSSPYGYYSDNMGGSLENFIVAGIASDGGADLFSITDDTTFGTDPGRGGTVASWTFTYEIDSSDSVYGTFTITYTATDNVANTNTVVFEFREDNTAPIINLDTGSIDETSDYLYYDGSSVYGYYSDNMGGTPDNFVIVGSASDTGVGLLSISDDTFFGGNPSRGGSLTTWNFVYAIDSGDSASGTFFITFTATDNVDNADTVTFQFREDNTAPIFSALSNFFDLDDDTGDNGENYTPKPGNGTVHAFYDESVFETDVDANDAGAFPVGLLSLQLNVNGGAYGTSDLDKIDVNCTLLANQISNIGYRLVDLVGNEATGDTGIDVYYSLTPPSGMVLDILGTGTWSNVTPSFAYIADATAITSGILFLGNSGDTLWSIVMNDDTGMWNGGGKWFVVFEGGWGNSSKNDSSSVDDFTSNSYHSNTGNVPSLWIDIVNQCGVSFRLTLTTTQDTTGPLMTSINVIGDGIWPTGQWDKDGANYIIDFQGYSDPGGSGISGWLVEYDNSNPNKYFTTTDNFVYVDDVGDGALNQSYTFWASPVDKVGNPGENRSDFGYIDEIAPVLGTISFDNPGFSTDWFNQGSVSSASLLIQFTEGNLEGISVTCVIDGSDRAYDWTAGGSPFNSTIAINGRTDGEYDIDITITDKAGNVDSSISIYQIKLDNTAPNMAIDLSDIIVNSKFLYWDSVGHILWYGDQMSISQSFTIGVNSDDGTGVGLAFAIAANDFGGNNNSLNDSIVPYDVPVVDIFSDDNWNGSLAVSVYDNLGNFAIDYLSVQRDTSKPRDYILVLIPDNASIDYKPNLGYYDNDLVKVYTNETGEISELGSGLPSDCYTFQIGSVPWSNWASAYNFDFTSVFNGIYSLGVKVRDNVGNNGTTAASGVTVDTTAPSEYGFSLSLTSATFNNATFDLTFNPEENDFFNMTILNNGSVGFSDFWFILWDEQDLFEPPSNETIVGLPRSKTFNYFGDPSGTFIVRLVNNAGNYQEIIINAISESRYITILISFGDIVFDAPYIYHDGVSDHAYYSDNMGESAFNITIVGTASTNGTGVMNHTIQDASFGGNPTNTGTATNWIFTYRISQADSSNGTFTVKFTGVDDIGKTGNETFEFRFDNTAPIITHNPGLTFEDSPYLYYDGSSSFGYYSANMGSSGQHFYVSGGVTELGSGISTLTDNTTFGTNPIRGGGGTFWQFDYEIANIDAGNDTFTIKYTATDNVGNYDNTTFEFRYDNTNPGIIFDPSGTSAVTPYLYYDGSSTYGYYSDNMGGLLQNFIIAGTASDLGAGISSIDDNATTFGNNPLQGGTLTDWTFTYAINSTDFAFGTKIVSYTVTDNVANSNVTYFEFRLDTTSPDLTTPVVEDSSSSPYVYINGTYFYFSNLMKSNGVQINISGTISDSDSGYYSVSYTSHFGDSPLPQINVPFWNAIYIINGTDPEQLAGITQITINGTDNVGNWKTTTVTFQKDNTKPTVSLVSLQEGEQPEYLHQINSTFIWYSTQGTGNRTFDLTILAGDSLSSISYSSFPDLFLTDGGDNSSTVNGTVLSRYWEWIYTIPDSALGSVSRTIFVFDHCGNNASIEFSVYEDTSQPNVLLQTVIESSDYLFYDGNLLYYSYDNPLMDELFEIRILTSDTESGTDSDSAIVTSTAFGETNSSSDDTSGYYSLYFHINENEDNTSIIVTAYDNTGNSNTTTLSLVIDNTFPTSLKITDVFNSTQYLYYDDINKILYFSSDQTMFGDFSIFLSAIDSGVGLSHAIGEDEFGETNINDYTPGDNFQLDYQINQDEVLPDGNVTIWIYDLVSNIASINLTCILDDTAPTILPIDTVIIEGFNLYFNTSQERLFYSNDQEMLNNFTIYVESFDLGVGLMEAYGEDDFNDSNIVDTVYSSRYELTYSVSQSDIATGDIIEISVLDLCGNIRIYNLDVSLDNIGPRSITISSVNDYGSNFIHYNGGSFILYVSNQSSIVEQFSLLISDVEPTNESGRLNATSEQYFGDSPGTTTYQYFLQYFINPGEQIPNGTLVIHTFDRVSNYNSVNLTIQGDLTPPRPITGPFYSENSDYLHTNGTHFFFSDNMLSTQILTISGTATDQLTGAGMDRVTYATAFGSSPTTDYSSSWSADYGIDADDTENGSSGVFYVTLIDRVNNSYSVPIYYVSDNIAPSGLTIFDISEDLLAEYLHYISGLTTLYYSNVRPDRGQRKFTIKVEAEDYGGAGLRNASFPDIGTGFSLGGYDTEYAIDLWNYTYSYDGSSGSANGPITITVYDKVGNYNTTEFIISQDLNNPYSLAFSDLVESSYYLYYDSGSTTFYYSNLATSSEIFTLKISAIDDESGLFSANGSIDFGEQHNTTPSAGIFSLTYSIDTGETASGNNLAVTVYDLTGNSAIFNFQCILDITPPTSLNIVEVIESSDYLHYNGSTLFVSNDQSMSSSFTIRISGSDTGSGRLNATGEADFNNTNVGDITYTTFYELVYSVERSDFATGNSVTITLYDKVGNSATIDLDVFIDNTGQSVVIVNIIETSEYIFYNNSVLYYSNNKPGMSEQFTIRITSTDLNAGRREAIGENEFGQINVKDTTYTTFYELTYTIDQTESASGNSLTVWVYDQTGNNNSVDLNFTLDNDAPSLVLLASPIETDHSNHLYFDSANTILYFSSDQPISDAFEIKIQVLEPVSGVQNVTGSTDFGETPSVSAPIAGTFNLQYIVDQSDTAGVDDQIIVWAYDNVGNVNSSFTLSAILDDTPPASINIEGILENSDLIYYSGTTVYYSNWHSGQASLFQINVTCEDLGSGLLSANGSTDFGETPSDDDFTPGYYLLEYVINQFDVASGNQVTISVYDNVHNINTLTLNLINDNTAPDSLIISSVIEFSDNLFYNSTSKEFFFSNDQFQSAAFTIRVTGSDSGAGLHNATGEEGEFNDFGVSDATYSTYYELTYTVNQTDGVTGNAITIRLYDRVGNNATVDLTCFEDNVEPSGAIISLIESSPYLYYNSTSFIFYFSSDQGMSDSLIIRVSSSDSGAGILNATGENEFNDINVGDITYSNYYELSYTVDQNDIVQGGILSIYLYDYVGNYHILNLTCVEDNTAPISGNIDSVQEVALSPYLYYSGTVLYYNNQNPMNDPFRMNISANDVKSGLKSVNGSYDFNEQHSSGDFSLGHFSLIYDVSAGEVASDNEIQILIYDQVGNSAAITLSCILDNDKPTLVAITDVVGPSLSEFLHYTGGTLFYSNINPSMSESFTIQVSGTDAGSGRLNATGEDDFGDTGVFDTTYSTYYALTYTVESTDIADGNTIAINFFDRVGNFETVYLNCLLDNSPPSAISVTAVGENAVNLFFNSTLKSLFYSNDDSLDSMFYILISATDSGVGLKNATGESDFSDPAPVDPSYVGTYNITYLVSNGEIASGDQISITVFDLVGNSGVVTLDCYRDNSAPTITITTPVNQTWYNTPSGYLSYTGNVSDNGGPFISGVISSNFQYSNDSGVMKYAFNSTLIGTSWTEEDEIAIVNDANVLMTIYVADMVGNTNNVSVEIWHDDTPPTIDYNQIISSPGESLSAGGTTVNYYAYPYKESSTFFDIDFFVNNEGHSFYSALSNAEYRTDDGNVTNDGWYPIFDSSVPGDYTTDWQISDWANKLFNGENTVDLRITDVAGNTLIHTFVSGVSGFKFLVDKDGPIIQLIAAIGDEGTVSNPSLYDHDGTDFNLSFIFNSLSSIEYIYIYSDDNPTAVKLDVGTDIFVFETAPEQWNATTQKINFDIGDTKNHTIYIRAENLAQFNSSWIPVHLFVDEDRPEVNFLNMMEISYSWTIHASGNSLYYSTNMLSNNAFFNITALASDIGSGVTDSDISFLPFESINWQNNTATGVFYVDQSTNPGDPYIKAIVVDASGQVSLTSNLVLTIQDQEDPFNLIISDVTESGENLFYDGTSEILFYSNDNTGMSDSFTIKLTALELISGIRNVSGSNDFGEIPVSFDNDSGSFDLQYIVDFNDIATGNSILITVHDNTGNMATITVDCQVDNDAPTSLDIIDVTGWLSSEYLYYNSSTEIFYYNNQNPSMNDSFKIQLTALELISGIQNVTGSFDFTESRSTETNLTGSFDLEYYISLGETASDDSLRLIVYDMVGNSAFIDLSCILDTNKPINLDIITVVESSEFLHYNTGSKTLFISNDESLMNEIFNVHVIGNDVGSGLQKANASEFGSFSSDNSYIGGYFDLSFSVNVDETAPTFNIIVWDRVGNSIPISLTIVIDNDAPLTPSIAQIEETSEYIYYNSPILYYSNINNPSMNELFTIHVTTSDGSGAGLQNATSSDDFGDSGIVDTSYVLEYLLNYTIGPGQIAGGEIAIIVYDLVGNSASTSLLCDLDNTPPTIPVIESITESSTYLFYNFPYFYYSNAKIGMDEQFTIQLTTDDVDSGRLNATGSSDFGAEIPFDLIYSGNYILSYNVNFGEIANDDKITIYIYDNVGNVIYRDLICYLDNDAPSINLQNTAITESSIYLYYPSNGTQMLWYSNNMPSGVPFNVIIDSDDGGQITDSGILHIEFPDIFDHTLPVFDIGTPYSEVYLVDSGSNFEGNMVFVTSDNCGNNDSISIEIHRDNLVPSATITEISESSIYIHSANNNTIWYSDLMGSFPETVTITLNAV